MFTLDINFMNRELTVDFMSFIVTTVMTMVIIWQTVKNARKQGETDRAIVEMQKVMHGEIIKEAQYRDRMECISFVDEVIQSASRVAGLKYYDLDSEVRLLMTRYTDVLSKQFENSKISIQSLWSGIDNDNLNEWILNAMKLKSRFCAACYQGEIISTEHVREIEEYALIVIANGCYLKEQMKEQMINKRHAT